MKPFARDETFLKFQKKFTSSLFAKIVLRKIQLGGSKIDRSKFCADHKDRKENIEVETYWEEKELGVATKETWARLKCGSVKKDRTNGYKLIKCSMCGKKRNSNAHLRM